MGSVSKILEQSQYTKEIGGVEFVLRRINPAIALKVYGSRLFGLVRAANTPAEAKNIYLQEAADRDHEKHVREMLRLCMVSPQLGDETDADTDTISLEDLELTGYGGAVVAELTGWADADFSESCEDQTDSASQETSTPSGSDTGSDQAG